MIEAVPKPDTPVFMDEVVVQIQDILKAQLPWLDHSFGRCQKLIDKDTSKIYPAVHLGYEKYVNVFPDQQLGNFSFIAFEDPQPIHYKLKPFIKVSQKFALIFWMDLSKVFVDQKDRNLEEVKLQILEVLNNKMVLTGGSLLFTQIYEEAKNIYKGYSVDEQKSQFLMHPFAGLRFEGTMIYENLKC